MTQNIEDKVVVITGASRELGEAADGKGFPANRFFSQSLGSSTGSRAVGGFDVG
jgi:hypothetical protein